MVQNDQNGITGGKQSSLRAMRARYSNAIPESCCAEFNVRKFRPRASIVDRMNKEVKDKAVKEAEALFA
jgi:hypothetical protein